MSKLNLVEEAEARTDASATFPATARDILVVDDVAANITAIEAALAPLARRIVTARSGIEALARLLDGDYALILLDVQMPEVDGYETARLIRARERSRHVPIIFVTAHERDQDAVLRAYELGAVDFLFKPLHADVLRAKAQVFIDLQDRTAQLTAKAEELRLSEAREHERLLELQRRELEEAALQREMAQQRRQTAELARLNQELALADRRKDEFLAILAHELRNPLAPIRTSLDLVRCDPAASPKVLEVIDRQVRHLTRLIDDLLDVSRITAGKFQLQKELVTIADVVEQAVTASRPAIDARQHRLDVRIRRKDLVVVGDPVRLVQVVSNLLHNAAKYTDPCGAIELVLDAAAEQALITVTDNGRGIEPALIARMFEMFVQERAGVDGAGGLGLGLALVRRLTELHGGSVSARSDGRGCGASFEIRLPLADDHARRSLVPTARTGPMPALPVAGTRTALRAVVVDDNPDLREMVADLLASFGHDVATAEDGPGGLALIRARRPDVAIVDIGLPGFDGYGLARAIRSELPGVPMRLVAMSGYGQENDRALALEAGFDTHIVKPASAATILKALDGRD